MNIAIFIGNLTRDPDTRIMTNGKPRSMFTIAVNRPYTNREGVREADFITCIAYDKTAELVEKYLAKGRKVAVEARVKTGKYTRDDGQTVYTTEFIVDRVEFLSSAQGQGSGGEYGQYQDEAPPIPKATYSGTAQTAVAAPPPPPPPSGNYFEDEDDLPF